jgi:hypothetical protein
MTRVLLVAEASRSIGEFRRPWVRRLHQAYLEAYRRRLATVVAGECRGAEVTMLASRDAVGPTGLAAPAVVRLYDEEVYQNDSGALAELGRRLIAGWWPERAEGSPLLHRGVWLPDLVPVAKGIVLRLDVLEQLGSVERVLDEVKPTRVVLFSGASVAEQLARALAVERGLPVTVACRFAPARLAAATGRLRRRRGRTWSSRSAASGISSSPSRWRRASARAVSVPASSGALATTPSSSPRSRGSRTRGSPVRS